MHSRLISLVRSSPLLVSLTIGSGYLAGLITISQAWLLSTIIDSVFIKDQTIENVSNWLLALLAFLAARGLFTWINEVAAADLAVRIKSALRTQVLDHIRALGPAFTRDERTGELATAATEGIEAMDAYFSQYLPQLFLTILVPLSILVCVFPIDLLSGIIMLFTAPLIPFFMNLIGKAAEDKTHRQYAQLSGLASHFLDSLQGLVTLKIFNRSKSQARFIARINEKYRDTTLGVLRYTFLSAFVLELLCTLSTAVIAVQIGLRLLYSGVEFQTAFFLLLLAPEFYMPLRMLGARFHAGKAGTAAARKIFEILDTPLPAVPTAVHSPVSPVWNFPENNRKSELEKFSIYIENVSFTYPNQDAPALQDINLVIPYGTHLALVGRTGAGKSTLGNLLLGFNSPTMGNVFTGSGSSLAPKDLRRMISWVSQTPHLFMDTIAANLRLARAGASDDDMVKAAQAAQLDDFIQTLPDRYQTMIGEGGARLSAGQAQRLALARALLKNAPILLLDEPTSSLDPETEFLLEQSTTQWMRGRTVITIAHRLNTVATADQIVVLDAGRIKETGTHEELLKRRGIYFTLVGACMPSTIQSVPHHEKTADPKRSVDHHEPNSTFLSSIKVKSTPQGSQFGRLSRFLSGSWKAVSLSILLAAGTTGSSVALLGTSALLISTAALHPSIGDLSLAIVGVRFFGISRGIFRYFERLVSHKVTLDLLSRLRTWFYERLEPLAPARLMQIQSGDLLARIVSDVNSLENYYVRVLMPPLVSVLVLICMALFLSHYHPVFALVQIAGFLTIGVGVPLLIYRLNQSLGASQIKRRGTLIALVVDGIQGLADLLVLDADKSHAKRIAESSRDYGESQRRYSRTTALGSASLVFFSGLTVWFLLRLSIPFVASGRLDGVMLGVIVLACQASFEALQPAGQIAHHWETSRSAADRLFEIVDATPSIYDSHPTYPFKRENGIDIRSRGGRPPALEMSDLTFRYPGSPVAALRDISFKVDQGHSLAIVGPSGAGKTSLVNLLLRFWEYSEGDIFLDGISLRELSQEYVRSQLSVLNQTPAFFNTSVAQNMKIAAPDASPHDMERAASLVNIDKMIRSLPGGYQTIVGEQGVRLSAGERQKLALARVVLRRAPLAILDEPTANLDPLTEVHLLENILDDLRNSATIVITHRLVGMERFDEILVMNHGQIIECGTHRQLLEQGGLYAHLLNLQNRIIVEAGVNQTNLTNHEIGR
jgi:ATP-binding cassette subfamily C protein CydCD